MKLSGSFFVILLLGISSVGCSDGAMESAPRPDDIAAAPPPDDSGGDDPGEVAGLETAPPEPEPVGMPEDDPGATLSAQPRLAPTVPPPGSTSASEQGPSRVEFKVVSPGEDFEIPDEDEIAAMEVPAPDPEPAATPEDEPPVAGEGYILEKIYYGTDRRPELTAVERQEDYATAVRRFQILLVTGLGLCGAAFFVSRRQLWLVLPAVLCLLGSGWFGRMALLEHQRSELDEAKQNRRYGNSINFVDGKHTLERGYCWVSVPIAVHEQGSGKLEEPGLLELQADPQQHFTLQRVQRVDRESFIADFRAAVQNSESKHAFVFIHGYNVLFREAALRTAQLRYDLDFDGPAALFSWPSNGSLLSYASDEETVNLTERSGVLHEFLTDFINETGAESIHLIAHSMGNRLLTRAFEKLPEKKNSQGKKMINQLIMAAPDVNPAEFRLLADRIRQLTRTRTLYASEKDIALIGSEVLRMSTYTRLGQGGASRVIVDGVQTVDASDLNKAIFDLGHSYYVHPQVMRDLRHLLQAGDTISLRPWLVSVDDYWTFRED